MTSSKFPIGPKMERAKNGTSDMSKNGHKVKIKPSFFHFTEGKI
jgi:hypothetical protein